MLDCGKPNDEARMVRAGLASNDEEMAERRGLKSELKRDAPRRRFKVALNLLKVHAAVILSGSEGSHPR